MPTLRTKRITLDQETWKNAYVWPTASSDSLMIGEDFLRTSKTSRPVQRVVEKITELPELKTEILLAGIRMCMSDKKDIEELVVKVGRLLDRQAVKKLRTKY